MGPGSEREFRQNPVALVFGAVFFAAGLSFQVGILGQVMRGEIRVRGRIIEDPSPWALLGTAAFPAIFWLAGLSLMVYAWNARVFVSERGIRITGIFGGTTFEATWTELSSVHRRRVKGGYVLKLETFVGKRASIVNSMVRFKELEAVIEAKRPDLWPDKVAPRMSPQLRRWVLVLVGLLFVIEAVLFIFVWNKPR